jgi:type IV secretion system protein VirB1
MSHAIPERSAVSALALAAAVALAGQCAPQVAPETLISVGLFESGLDPLTIHDNTSRQTLHPPTIPAAALFAADRIAAGHSVDLGLMQVNSTNLRPLHLTVFDAFDACSSMRAGGQVLQHAYTGGGTVDEQQHALRVALSRYNTGGPVDGFANGYVGHIERVAERFVPAIVPGPYSSHPMPPPAPAVSSGDVWDDEAAQASAPARAALSAPSWDVWRDETEQPAAPARPVPPSTEKSQAAPVENKSGLVNRIGSP